MKTYSANDGVWQELIPSTTKLSPSADAVVDIMKEAETPTSTVTPDYGKQFVLRLKTQHQLSANGSGKFSDGQLTPVYRTINSLKQTKLFPGRVRKRIVLKNGNVNLSKEHIDNRSQRYLQDTFTTMVDIQWRWNLLVFAMGFFLSWFGFAVLWWLICFAHGDFEHLDDESWTPCVENIKSFTSAYLFSIETQHTIGYGSRFTHEECPEAIFIMCIQSITGVMIQCFMVGFVFAKLSRPQKRSQTLMFSRNAIICLRDGKMCLMFRVGDVRNRSHIIGASISAQVISRKVTLEGEVIPYYHTHLEVKFDNLDGLFLIWPATIVHEISENSPFYTLCAEELIREKLEIVVYLEGTVESTGQSIQARSSYLPSEILWGHRFEQLVSYRRETAEYKVDYSKFNSTYEIDTPTCSAKEVYEEQRIHQPPNNLLRIKNYFDASKSSSSDETRAESGDNANATNSLTISSLNSPRIFARHSSGKSSETS